VTVNRSQDTDDLLPDLDLADVMRQRPLGLGSVRHVVRVAIAVTVSFGIATAISQSTLGIFAPITTLIVVQATAWTTLGVSVQRILGTGMGVLAASLWVNLVGLTWWSFLLGVLVALLVARALPWSLGGQLQIPVAVAVLALDRAACRPTCGGPRRIGGVTGLLAVHLPAAPGPRWPRASFASTGMPSSPPVAVARESDTYSESLPDDVLHDYGGQPPFAILTRPVPSWSDSSRGRI
jgi:hypothetical protein